MIGAYKSDYVRVSGYNVKKFRYGWGGEDIDLINRFVRHGYTVIRPKEHGLLHRWHKKVVMEEKKVNAIFTGGKGHFARPRMTNIRILLSINIHGILSCPFRDTAIMTKTKIYWASTRLLLTYHRVAMNLVCYRNCLT